MFFRAVGHTRLCANRFGLSSFTRHVSFSHVRNKDLFNFELNVEEHLRDGKKKQTEDRDDGSNASIATKEESSKVSPQETYVKPKDDSLLDDIFADLVFENQAGSNELDKVFQDITDNSKYDHSLPINLDKTTEDHLFPPRESHKSKLVSMLEEQNLFQNIFETYAQKESAEVRDDKLENQVLRNLQESFNASGASSANSTKRTFKYDQLDQPAMKEILDSMAAALTPTLEVLDGFTKKLEVIQFATRIFERYHLLNNNIDTFYLHKKKSETAAEFKERCNASCKEVEKYCASKPDEPVLNVYTMPLIFNRVLRVLNTKLYDGQLALTLFHAIKKDINLYTVVCNQETYNEILKTYWVYMGKASLCEVELVFLEMTNNGFAGDLATFSIIKEILASYHTMRIGKSLYNPGGMPIWSQEDERRAKNLGAKLRKLGNSLRKQRFGA